jgi:type VI secretion system protein ImpA
VSAVNISHLMKPISETTPSGIDLSGDARIFQLRVLASGKPSRYEGSKEFPAEEPNWISVRESAEEILKASKDLRVAMYLVRALIKTDGYSGLAAGLSLLQELTASYWDSFYPRLDPNEKNDPTERINIFEELKDDVSFVKSVRLSPLVASREVGRFSLRDYELANGKISAAAGAGSPTLATINACFRVADVNEIKETASAIQHSLDSLHAILKIWPSKFVAPETDTEAIVKKSDAIVAAQAPATGADGLAKFESAVPTNVDVKTPNFEPLINTLTSAQKVIEAGMKVRGDSEGGITPAEDAANPTTIQTQNGAALGLVRTRDDCVRAIDLVADYFRKHERSSPIPLILERAKRLMTKDFLEIMQDLAPDGVTQAAKVFGTDPKKT